MKTDQTLRMRRLIEANLSLCLVYISEGTFSHNAFSQIVNTVLPTDFLRIIPNCSENVAVETQFLANQEDSPLN